MKYKLILFLGLLFLFPLLSAGLTINPSLISVDKTAGSDKIIYFDIVNTESFTFFNITFEQNNIIQMPMVQQLGPGMGINVSATISNDVDFNGVVKIQGLYLSQLGQNFDTHNIQVNYNTGLSECDKSITEGDSVNWINEVLDDIQIVAPYPMWTNNIISQGSSGLHQFSIPGESFSYYFKRSGFVFTSVCSITVLDDAGLIHNPGYDASLSLDINVIYPETNISVNIPGDDYIINVFTNAEGILSITNTGSKIAKNVKLTANWFTFSENNFDLNPGETNGLIYTITPIVTTTEDTNKTYNKTLLIEGNFPTYNYDFTINIPYSVISGNNITQGMTFKEWLDLWCVQNPSDSLCVGKTVVIGQNGTENKFNVTYSEEQMKALYDFWFRESDSREEFERYDRENSDLQSGFISNISFAVSDISQELNAVTSQQKQLKESITILFIFFMAIMGVALFYLYFNHFKKTKRIDAPRGSLLQGYQT